MSRIVAPHHRDCPRSVGMFAIRAESPNSPRDSRDRAVVIVDYRRYHQITGFERNEIVRRHVGAKQAKKSRYSGTRAAGKTTERRKQCRRIAEAGVIVVRETSLKVSSSRRPSARVSRASSDNGDAGGGRGKKKRAEK